jgi:hypothetical protein
MSFLSVTTLGSKFCNHPPNDVLCFYAVPYSAAAPSHVQGIREQRVLYKEPSPQEVQQMGKQGRLGSSSCCVCWFGRSQFLKKRSRSQLKASSVAYDSVALFLSLVFPTPGTRST